MSDTPNDDANDDVDRNPCSDSCRLISRCRGVRRSTPGMPAPPLCPDSHHGAPLISHPVGYSPGQNETGTSECDGDHGDASNMLRDASAQLLPDDDTGD